MGVLDAVVNEAESKLGINSNQASTLLSGLLGLINEQAGGLGGLLDRFRRAGLGDSVSSWLSGGAKTITTENAEAALGSDTIQKLANKAGLSFGTAASALAFLLPKLVQRLAPGGVVPTHLPSDMMAYITGPTGAIASGARQAAYATERAVRSTSLPRFLWPLLALLAVFVIGLVIWNTGGPAKRVAFNAEEQVRLAGQKASAALAALKPGFTVPDLLGALNLEVINFSTGSAQIPADGLDFLRNAAVAIKAAPGSPVIEVAGHTDNVGSAEVNLRLSQQRADAVRDYLVGQGVSSAQLVAKGYGDSRPLAGNETEEGRFRNRRIEFVAVQ